MESSTLVKDSKPWRKADLELLMNEARYIRYNRPNYDPTHKLAFIPTNREYQALFPGTGDTFPKYW